MSFQLTKAWSSHRFLRLSLRVCEIGGYLLTKALSALLHCNEKNKGRLIGSGPKKKCNKKKEITAHGEKGQGKGVCFSRLWLVYELQCLKWELGTQRTLCQFTQHLFWTRIQFYLQMLIVKARSASTDASTPIRLLQFFRFNHISPNAEGTGDLNKHTWTGVKL